MKIIESKVYCDEHAKIDEESIIDELNMDLSISINGVINNIYEIKVVYFMEGLIGGMIYSKKKVFCFVNEDEYSIFGKYHANDDGKLYIETKYGFILSENSIEEVILSCLRFMSSKSINENYTLAKAIALFYSRVKANEFLKKYFHEYMFRASLPPDTIRCDG